MNKIILVLLLTTSLTASANAQNCVNASRCDELGYTKTTADCAGLDTLVCPFDKNKAFCTTGVTGGITSCNELITAINNQETEILLAKDITCSFADFKLGPLVTNSNTLEASFTFPPNVTFIGLGGKKKLTIPSFKTAFGSTPIFRPISIVVDNATFKNIDFAVNDAEGGEDFVILNAVSAKPPLNLENCGGSMETVGNVNFNGKNNFDVLRTGSGTANVPEGATLYAQSLSVFDDFIVKGELHSGDKDITTDTYLQIYGKYFLTNRDGGCYGPEVKAYIKAGGFLYMASQRLYPSTLDITVEPGAQIAYQASCSEGIKPDDCTSSQDSYIDGCESGLWQANGKGDISWRKDWYKLLTRIGDYQE